MAGVADDVYRPLSHSEWHGCTPTDLIFPCFLFIVGVAMTFSLSKYTAENKPTKAVYLRILRRTAILFILGLVLNGFWNKGIWTFDLSSIRLMGVLQRIALTYLFASLIVLKLPRKSQWLVAGGLLIAYWLTMMYIPVPDYGAGVLTREGNFGAFIDRLIIPKAHLYKGDGFNFMGDPEGLFSTIPAIVSVLAGYFTGEWIKDKKQATSQTSMDLVLFGLCCLVLNAIALFVASVFLIKITAKTQIGTGESAISIYNWIYQNIFASWSGNFNGSFLFALVTLLFWYGVAVLMYQKRWFIKV
jgi:predicted acyltransferase